MASGCSPGAFRCERRSRYHRSVATVTNIVFDNRHAGYSYSGETAAYAYNSLDLTGMYLLAMALF